MPDPEDTLPVDDSPEATCEAGFTDDQEDADA